MNRIVSQRNLILADLKAGETLTPMKALHEHGCFRLAARILELRQAGYPIERSWGKDGEKRWAVYRLVP